MSANIFYNINQSKRDGILDADTKSFITGKDSLINQNDVRDNKRDKFDVASVRKTLAARPGAV